MAKSSTKGHYQRLRERFLQNGPGARSEESLLELLLSYSIGKRDVKEMAQTLLHHFGSLQKVLSSTPEELLQIKGIGFSSVSLLKAIHFLQTQEPEPSVGSREQPVRVAQRRASSGSLLALIDQNAGPAEKTSQTRADQDQVEEQSDADKKTEEPSQLLDAGTKTPERIKKKQSTKSKDKPQPFVAPGKNRKLQISNSYYLEFDQLARVFYFLREHKDSKTIKRKIMCEELGLAESQVKSLVSMGNAMGLIKPKSHALTALGAVIAKNDIFFEQKGTLDLCHFIAAGSSTNLIWFELFNTLLPQENALSMTEAAQILQTDLSGQYTEKTLKKHIRKELRFVANAYQEQNFRKLDLLKQTNDGKLYVRRYLQMHPFILAAALYDFGTRIDSELLQVSDMIITPGSPALVFGLDQASLVELVETLHEHELVRYETAHNLNQIRLKSYVALDFVKAYYQDMAPAQFSSRWFTGDDT